MTPAERQAIQDDAQARLRELYAVERTLRSDLDDMHVLSEWTIVKSEIAAAERALHERSEAA